VAYDRAYVAPNLDSIRFQNSLSRTLSTVRPSPQGNLVTMSVDVVHQPGQSRFEAEEGQAVLTYELSDGVVAFTHTIVPPELSGRGIAGELATTAVAWARGEGLDIEPRCPYVRSWLAKNG
jgi:predicted GNAT family acetyltransferase